MGLCATAQSSFIFLGKKRKIGAVISAAELDEAIANDRLTLQARDAMVSQKMIVLSEEGPDGLPLEQVTGSHDPDLIARLDAMEENQRLIMEKLGIEPVAVKPSAKPEKVKKTRKTRRGAVA